jgi:hypothetical protein
MGMAGWDACTEEPNRWLRWIECHPGFASWLQAGGTIVAIAIAIAIPLILRLREERYQRRQYVELVADALRSIALTAYTIRPLLWPMSDEQQMPADKAASEVRAKLLEFVAAGRIIRDVTIERLGQMSSAAGILNIQSWLKERLPAAERILADSENDGDYEGFIQRAKLDLEGITPICIIAASVGIGLGKSLDYFDKWKSR